jgi:hypothetical protein
MARTGPSAADRQLISQLAARDLSVSAAQLERWRHAGLLPRNSRHGSGRGRGSASEASPEAVEIAAALSRHTKWGRDLRLAVIDWFADAGRRPIPGETAVPEPPHAAVRSALMWLVAANPAHQLLQLARSARTEADRDEFYDAADAAVPGPPSRPVVSFDPAVVREALLTRRDPPEGTVRSGQEARSGWIQLIAAMGMGYAEIGDDALAEALADTGLALQMPAPDGRWLAHFRESPAGLQPLVERYDPLDMLSQADAEGLQRARTAALDLAMAGGLYFFHALLLPDTPGLAGLRATIDGLGLGPWLLMTFRNLAGTDGSSIRTDGFAFTVVSCLHPFMSAVHTLLAAHIEGDPPLLPDNTHDAEKFMADWMTTLKDTARRRDQTADG